MTVAVLALQGAFAEHEKVLKRLGVNCIELRQAKDLETPYNGIILPGGESTVQGKLLKELGMFDMILSILVDTFISKISLTMQPGPKIDSISGA